eukprot:4094258-Heterocapsa_arctica.AAC.1
MPQVAVNLHLLLGGPAEDLLGAGEATDVQLVLLDRQARIFTRRSVRVEDRRGLSDTTVARPLGLVKEGEGAAVATRFILLAEGLDGSDLEQQ